MRRRSLVWRTMTLAYCSSALALVADERAELAAQPLGGELDRRQRVLDLVGDAAGDVAPGGHALGDDEVGHVVEGDDVCPRACRRRAGARRRAPGGRGRGRAAEPDLALAMPAGGSRARAGAARTRARRPRAGRRAGRVAARGRACRSAAALITSTRPSPSRPMTPAVTPESTESNRRRRRSVSSLAAIELVALGLHLRGHVVEGGAEHAISSWLSSTRTRTSRSPCPTRSAAARGGRPAWARRSANHRPSQIVPRITTSGEAEVDQRELEDEPAAVALELVVERDGLGGLVEQAEDLAVDLAADVEEAVGELVEVGRARGTRCWASPG
jgi:hypothetical protein